MCGFETSCFDPGGSIALVILAVVVSRTVAVRYKIMFQPNYDVIDKFLGILYVYLHYD